MRGLSKSKGKYGVEGRLAVRSLIIQHSLSLSHREVIETFIENNSLEWEVLVDNIYLTRENRKWLKERDKISGKPSGRLSKKESYHKRAKKRKEHREKNHIETKVGIGKYAYRLKEIRARRQDTSESSN